MDAGSALSTIGMGLLLTAALLYVIASATTWFGGLGATIKTAAIVAGAVGLVIQLLSGMVTSRSSDTSMHSPPEYAQPPGYQNPYPGGPVPYNPAPGQRPPGSQFPPPPPGGGVPVTISVQGNLALAGQLDGTLQGGGGVQLALEAGSQQVPVPAK